MSAGDKLANSCKPSHGPLHGGQECNSSAFLVSIMRLNVVNSDHTCIQISPPSNRAQVVTNYSGMFRQSGSNEKPTYKASRHPCVSTGLGTAPCAMQQCHHPQMGTRTVTHHGDMLGRAAIALDVVQRPAEGSRHFIHHLRH